MPQTVATPLPLFKLKAASLSKNAIKNKDSKNKQRIDSQLKLSYTHGTATLQEAGETRNDAGVFLRCHCTSVG